MPSTSLGFPYPADTAADNVPYDMQQLAAAANDKALVHTAGSPKRVHVQTGLTGTTDASGYVTFNHGAPFTPRVCQVIVNANAASLAYLISVNPPTSTTVQARFGNWSAGGNLASASLGAAGNIVIISWE